MKRENNPPEEQPNNPLHGVKLATILDNLLERYGWEGLSERVHINCFKTNPSVNSSLKFLRKTKWARDKVEALYLEVNKKKSFQDLIRKVEAKPKQDPETTSD